MGKSEGEGENWHGHVTVLTVSPFYRRLGVARALMGNLESASEQGKMYFVDLFVRMSNKAAIGMYEGMGYCVYRRVLDYYSGPDEDALDMRKALSRDKHCKSMVPLLHPVHADDLDY